jgi:tRNA dimethylallyltransferase
VSRSSVIAIAGPTATGKSACGALLARKLGGEVISADSAQIYRGMDIGTAKVSRQEMLGVPHHLIDIRDPSESYSAAQFVRDALEIIDDLHRRGKVPILVGGTGFYVHAVLYPLDFGGRDADPLLRERLEEKSGEALYGQLMREDPSAADRLHPNDRKRVIRALEIALSGGRKGGGFRQMRPRFDDAALFGLTMSRESLYRRIEWRVDQMMAAGFLDEVRNLLAQDGVTRQSLSMQSLGYKQLAAHLAGEFTLEEAVEEIKKQTRRFAKRQLTWFRREEGIRWLDVETHGNAEEIVDKMMEVLEEQA